MRVQIELPYSVKRQPHKMTKTHSNNLSANCRWELIQCDTNLIQTNRSKNCTFSPSPYLFIFSNIQLLCISILFRIFCTIFICFVFDGFWNRPVFKCFVFLRVTVCSCHFTYAFQKESTLLLPESQGTPCSKQARNLKFKWLQPVWLNGWLFVYELNGCGFESTCSHLKCLIFSKITLLFKTRSTKLLISLCWHFCIELRFCETFTAKLRIVKCWSTLYLQAYVLG